MKKYVTAKNLDELQIPILNTPYLNGQNLALVNRGDGEYDLLGQILLEVGNPLITFTLVKVRLENGVILGESLEFNLNAPLISAETMGLVKAFFARVYREHASEAMIFLLYSPETGEWFPYPPKQKVSPAALNWELTEEVPDGWLLVGDIHSHAGMSAFHSSTDTHDEINQAPGIHITEGAWNSHSASIVINGFRLKVPYELLVETPDDVEVPEVWMQQVEYQPYSYRKRGTSWKVGPKHSNGSKKSNNNGSSPKPQ